MLVSSGVCVSMWNHHHSHSDECIRHPTRPVPSSTRLLFGNKRSACCHDNTFPLSRIFYKQNPGICTHWGFFSSKSWFDLIRVVVSVVHSAFLWLSGSACGRTTACPSVQLWMDVQLFLVWLLTHKAAVHVCGCGFI